MFFSRFLKSHTIILQIIVTVSLRACFLPWLPGHMEAEIFNIQIFGQLLYSVNPLEGGGGDNCNIFNTKFENLCFYVLPAGHCGQGLGSSVPFWEFLNTCFLNATWKILYHPEGPPLSNCCRLFLAGLKDRQKFNCQYRICSTENIVF